MDDASQKPVPEALAGQRLDAVVAELFGMSGQQAKQAIAHGRVAIDGRIARKKAVPIHAGQTLVCQPLASQWLPTPAVPIDVVAESADWLVVNKPAGVPVLPKQGATDPSLVTGLMAHRPADADWASLAAVDQAACHRLDTPTSGLVLFAKRPEVHAAIRDGWDDVTKTYLARVSRSPLQVASDGILRASAANPCELPEGTLVAHLGMAQHRPAKVRADNTPFPGSRRCQLTVLDIQAADGPPADGPNALGGWLLVRLDTGFLHQIRVMLAHLGWPIDGDTLYGGKPAERLMLHAWRLDSPRFEIHATAPLDGLPGLPGLLPGQPDGWPVG